MAAGDINPVYISPTTSTGGLTSLGTSATWVAGYEWFVVDCAGMSPIPRDVRISGKVRVGTTPTANTFIRLYLIPSEDGTVWPDVFDGTPSAETVTSVGVRDSFAKLAAVLWVDTNTTDRDYPFSFSALEVFGGSLPDSFAVFVTHNTAVNLNSTGSAHVYLYAPQYDHVAQS